MVSMRLTSSCFVDSGARDVIPGFSVEALVLRGKPFRFSHLHEEETRL
jgi:hypothetical protein